MAEAWRESQRTNLHNHYDGMEYQANITFLVSPSPSLFFILKALTCACVYSQPDWISHGNSSYGIVSWPA